MTDPVQQSGVDATTPTDSSLAGVEEQVRGLLDTAVDYDLGMRRLRERLSRLGRGPAEAPSVRGGLWRVDLRAKGTTADNEAAHVLWERLQASYGISSSIRYDLSRLALSYWAEAADLHEAMSGVLHTWRELTIGTSLQNWEITSLEVLDESTARSTNEARKEDSRYGPPRPTERPRRAGSSGLGPA